MSVTIICAFIIITSGQSNLTLGCFATADEWFTRICQVAPVCRPMRAHLRHLTNRIEHVSYSPLESITQTASQLVQPIFHSSRQSVLIFYNGLPSPLKIAHSNREICTPSFTWFLGPIQAHNPNGISIGSVIFAECHYTLQWAAPSPLKIAPSHGGSGYNTWFLGPTWVLNPNSISISSAVFAGLTSVTDRPRYSVGNNRLHLRT